MSIRWLHPYADILWASSGQKEAAFDTLTVVCPRPPGAGRNSILVGTNTDLVRRLLSSVLDEDGSTTNKIHPQLRQACRWVEMEKKALKEEVGRLWKLEAKERILQPGEVT